MAEWCSLFLEVEVSVLAAITSDHKPLLVRFAIEPERWARAKPFRFKANWNVNVDCGKLIKLVWAEMDVHSNSLQSVHQKLQNYMHALKSWSSSKYVHAGSILKRKTKRLTLLQQNEYQCDWAEIKSLQQEIDLLLEIDDLQWKQRSKHNWFSRGGIVILNFFTFGRLIGERLILLHRSKMLLELCGLS